MENISLQFNAQNIFKQITWHLRPGDRVGLVGVNGSGKTTLLRIIKGEQLPDSGTIQRTKDIQMGYLPQETCYAAQTTVLDYTMSGVE